LGRPFRIVLMERPIGRNSFGQGLGREYQISQPWARDSLARD
jgi:hypothetical protein